MQAEVHVIDLLAPSSKKKVCISVNSVFPGPTKTPLMEKEVSKDELERIGNAMTLGRMGEPEDIAGVVAFLASEEGAWVNGQQIIVNGGGRI